MMCECEMMCWCERWRRSPHRDGEEAPTKEKEEAGQGRKGWQKCQQGKRWQECWQDWELGQEEQDRRQGVAGRNAGDDEERDDGMFPEKENVVIT